MDKREIAANMLLRAIKSYVKADNDFDYIQSILLAGSSLGVTEPLLNEVKFKTASEKSADTIIAMKEARFRWEKNKLIIDKSVRTISQKKRKEVIKQIRNADLKVYNSLKHTGKFWDKTPAYDDLNIEIDFKETAENIIYNAIDDFNSIVFDERFEYHELPNEIILLLNCGDPLGTLPKFVCKEPKNP